MMKMMRSLLALFFLFCPSVLFAFPASIMHIYDGDIITVAPLSDTNNPLFVCLYGIDAPALKQQGGNESRLFLAKLLPLEASVEIIPMGFDSFGRIHALVGYKGKIINRQILEEGHAWVSTNWCRAMLCRSWKALEKEAKDAGKGLWQKKNPIAPWLWGKDGNPLELMPSGKKAVDPDALLKTKEWFLMDPP